MSVNDHLMVELRTFVSTVHTLDTINILVKLKKKSDLVRIKSF